MQNITLFLSIILIGCSSRPSTDLDNYVSRDPAEVPDLVKAVSCLKDDGYEFGYRRKTWFELSLSAEKNEDDDHYTLVYADHPEIKHAKDFLANHETNEEVVNDSLLGGVDIMIAVILTKQYGSAWDYDHADIKIEEWTYPSSEWAESALHELQRLNTVSFGHKWDLFDRIENRLYFFSVESFTKKDELERVKREVMVALSSI